MKPVSTPIKVIALFLLLLGPPIVFFIVSKGDHKFQDLPYYGPKEVIYLDDGSTDTLYHQVPGFELVNQFGETVSQEQFEGDILIADFFFTTCPTICPKMSNHMSGLQLQLKDNHFKNVKLLSHTVDPVTDTPQVLLHYGEDHEANFDKWTFLTGDKQAIYQLGVKGYLLPAQEDALAPGGFLHSEQFVLVDAKRHIRGYYDGTDLAEMRRLVKDVKMLLKLSNEQEN